MSKRKSVRFVEDIAPTDKKLLRMSKRLEDGENGDGDNDDAAYSDIGRKLEPRPGEKQNVPESKHTLDSDEEDEEKYDRLAVDDVEGQEDATVDFDENTKITPFNMAEEMEEGHFDSDGTFIFNKKSEQIRDAWLDNIDWAKIKKDAGDQWQGEGPDPADQDSRSPTHIDRSDIYESILKYLKPQETITKALKRLGGSRTMADVRQARWKEKKSSKKLAPEKEQEEDTNNEGDNIPTTSETDTTPIPLDENAQAVTRLTELVDSLVSEGEFEIYGFTYERIKHELEKYHKEKAAKQAMETGPVTDDSALDMFAEEIDVKELKKDTASQKEEKEPEKDDTQSSNEVRWEFKWKNEDQAEIHGPCSSQQMQAWTDEGYFKDGVWVRRVDQKDAPFYTSKRIDFELYI